MHISINLYTATINIIVIHEGRYIFTHQRVIDTHLMACTKNTQHKYITTQFNILQFKYMTVYNRNKIVHCTTYA